MSSGVRYLTLDQVEVVSGRVFHENTELFQKLARLEKETCGCEKPAEYLGKPTEDK